MWIVFVLLLVSLLPEIIEVISSCLPDRQWRCVKTIPLIELRRNIDLAPLERRCYVLVRKNKAIFAFTQSKDYTEKYKEKTVRGKIEVRADKEIIEPVLKICQHVPVYDCRAFTSVIARTKYVFYVPKDAVLYLDSEKLSSKVTSPQVV